MSKVDNVLLEQTESCKDVEEAKEDVSLEQLVVNYHVPQELVNKWCAAGHAESLNELDEDKKQKCIELIMDKYANMDNEIVRG